MRLEHLCQPEMCAWGVWVETQRLLVHRGRLHKTSVPGECPGKRVVHPGISRCQPYRMKACADRVGRAALARQCASEIRDVRRLVTIEGNGAVQTRQRK